MAELDLSKATTVNLKDNVPDFVVNSMALDVADDTKTFIHYPEASTRFGYYLQIPEIYSAINALATWAFGRGWTTPDEILKQELEHISGMGRDTFDQIIWNHEVMKLVTGDAFIEVVRDKGIIVNMLNISPERVKTEMKGARIIGYEIYNGKKWVPKKMEEMIHSHNKRFGDNVRGNSQFIAATDVIDAKNEAQADERVIKHRDKALGIVEYDTDDEGKITFMNSAIQKGVADGDMVGYPKDTGEIKPWPSKSSEDRQSWIAYLENFIYQVIGVPRSIATNAGNSETGGKLDNVNFDPTHTKERTDMEADLWSQQAIEIAFNKQASLGGLQQEEEKNTGQVNIQPNDVEASLPRE